MAAALMMRSLAKLSRAIDWRFLEAQFGSVYSDRPGQINDPIQPKRNGRPDIHLSQIRY
jgi:hypothetical protein